jgi:membrane protein involved in colicin uptake
LGLDSVEELEGAIDAMEGIAEDGSELDTTNISREARLRSAYMDWCKEYGKESDEARFQTFTSNYLAMEEYAEQNGKEMQLNMYADCTEEEYTAQTAAATEEVVEVVEEAPVVDAAAEAKAKEEAEKAKKKAEEAKAKADADKKAAADAKVKADAQKKAAEAAEAGMYHIY